jgi:polysaccharide biosynthesis protein PslH
MLAPRSVNTINRMPRLLFLSQTLPYPPHGGVQLRTFNVLRLLARHFDITTLCFGRRSTHPSPQSLETGARSLADLGDTEAFFIPQEHSVGRLAVDHIRSVITRQPYTVYTYDSRDFRRALINRLGRHRFDIVHLDSLDLAGYLPHLKRFPVVCAHHNMESQLLRRRSENEQSLLRRHYLAFQSTLLENQEKELLPSMDLNIVVSDSDRRNFQRVAPNARLQVVPNGVDTTFFSPGKATNQGIAFVGGYGWYPNRDALHFFADQILPLLRRTTPGFTVHWIGRAPHSIQQAYRSEHDINVTGYVDDIRPLVQAAKCYVVPIRVGGGTRLKILDAWSMGKAVVSTSIGCEGLDARDGENILIRDTPEGFAEAVMAIMNDDDLRHRLEVEARRTAEQLYDWEVIEKCMVQHYRSLL